MTRIDLSTLADAGMEKAALLKSDLPRFFTHAALTGAFIFVGALLSSLTTAWFYTDYLPVARFLGAITFSAALLLVVLLGGELFTGLTLIMSFSLYEGKVTPAQALRVWVVSYAGNFIGIFILCLLLAGSGASRDLLSPYLALTIPGKLATPWYSLLLKGVLCNFFVCLGVFSGFRMKSDAGKVAVIISVITTFVLAGLEHSIANMVFFCLYTLYHGPAQLSAIAWNLLWVTLGNLLGGGVLLGLPLWFISHTSEIKSPQ
jgi:nitrite transporter NirC